MGALFIHREPVSQVTGVTSECGDGVKGIGIGYLVMADQAAFRRGIFGPLHLTFPQKNKADNENR